MLARLPADCPYCVAVGAVAGAHGDRRSDALAAFLQAFAANLVQAAIRLGVIGQTGAVAPLAGLEPWCSKSRPRGRFDARRSRLGYAFVSDVMAMRHETQYSRLFRS